MGEVQWPPTHKARRRLSKFMTPALFPDDYPKPSKRGDNAMKKILLSLAPVPVETLKSLIHRSPGVPDFEVIDGHDISGEELATAFAKADASSAAGSSSTSTRI